MENSWTPKSAPSIDSPEAGIRSMDWDEAQPWCNFVLMKPTSLPDGLAIEKMEMRPEAPPGRTKDSDSDSRPTWTKSNRSCHRFELVGKERRLRIKQFLYDWAPPAFDHPSLWKSQTIAFEVGNDIGWLGNDFRGHPGASLSVDRTMIEMSVNEGTFTDEEHQAICRGFSPAIPEVRQQIITTSLAELSYQRRHVEMVIAVPVGYWAHKRFPPRLPSFAVRSDEAPEGLPGDHIIPPPEYNYCRNSIFLYGEPGTPQEIDFVYELDDQEGRYIRVLASQPAVSGGITYPPVLDQQPCSSQVINIGGHEVYYAFNDERYGPHEAVWQSDGLKIMLLVKPTPSTDRTWFEGLLSSLVVA